MAFTLGATALCKLAPNKLSAKLSVESKLKQGIAKIVLAYNPRENSKGRPLPEYMSV
jgi:hypothetical protein